MTEKIVKDAGPKPPVCRFTDFCRFANDGTAVEVATSGVGVLQLSAMVLEPTHGSDRNFSVENWGGPAHVEGCAWSAPR